MTLMNNESGITSILANVSGKRAARDFGVISPNTIRRGVINNGASQPRLSPIKRIKLPVNIADAKILTISFPIKIEIINRRGR